MNRITKLVFWSLFIAVVLSAHPAVGAKRAVKPKAKKNVPTLAQTLEEAHNAFDEYRFADGIKQLDLYDDRAVNATSTDDEITDNVELRRRMVLGLSMLERVEKIAIIDSVTLPLDELLTVYRLSTPAGMIVKSEALSASFGAAPSTTAYMTEGGDHLIWTSQKGDSSTVLRQSWKLIDGEWETPSDLTLIEDDGVSEAYPFLMPDGTTLYFAANGSESLGGYDIFMTRRDNDGYLQPINVGMPYNSPANDYMLAIDEVTGAGWWATDRNAPEGMVTVYMFVPQELRINYATDAPNLVGLARANDIAATQEPGKDYNAIKKSVAEAWEAATKGKAQKAQGPKLTLPNGKVITDGASLKSPVAVQQYENYAEAMDELRMMKDDLNQLRSRYAGGDRSVTTEIRQLETECRRAKEKLKRLSNAVITAELDR